MNILQPLVSVIILTFNSQAHIGRAITSVRRQTYKNIEIVVVDNGSTDETQRIVDAIGGVVWHSLPNSDMGMARNFGVKHSSGEFLMFLDSDDFYLANKIESQVTALIENPRLEVLFSLAYIYRSGKANLLGLKLNTINRLSFIDFLNGHCYTLATICIRRSVWSDDLAFGEGDLGRYGEDWRFQINLVAKGVIYDVLDTALVVVEIREGSHTTWAIQPKMKALALTTVEQIFLSRVCGEIGVEVMQKILDRYRFKLIISLLLVGRRVEAGNIKRKVNSLVKSFAISLFMAFSAIFPHKWVRYLLEFIWTKRQDRTFQWFTPPKNIEAQLSAFSNYPMNTKWIND